MTDEELKAALIKAMDDAQRDEPMAGYRSGHYAAVAWNIIDQELKDRQLDAIADATEREYKADR